MTASSWLADMLKEKQFLELTAQFSPEVVSMLLAIALANNEPLSVTIVNMVIRGLESMETAVPCFD